MEGCTQARNRPDGVKGCSPLISSFHIIPRQPCPDHLLLLKVIRIPGSAKIVLATGGTPYVYGRELGVARGANAMMQQDAKGLVAQVAIAGNR